ncbi:glycoside hydrolase family 13 protein [Deinococcus peraridilitoris]|uniref:Glycosidase n=1 Tax=Deinococcus peraridilitoris (strain DSM 19664 / LMG 22246 / CIP 109416 / KR-200) TaxID=937777 RepID=K9ZXL5_DEIPD|nr:glycoside hydrolase family 13 protein [Deinococcus peraridilitoris]AFZ65632.1 glycosidase [Deinococcus peraridilitoris DSM 19664]
MSSHKSAGSANEKNVIRTPDWVKDAVFYQIFPDRFAFSERLPKPAHLQAWGDKPHPHKYQGGDLLGVIERLDHLVDLGVNAIYFCPVFRSASNHRYHTHDYFQVDPMLGGNEALRELIDAAHARGLKVVLDGVFNHASRGFFQFNDILENGEHSAYLDWFHIERFPLHPYEGERPGNYQAWWGNRALPKFNTDTPAVREFLWSVATYWTEFGIDGWRLDVPNEIDDDEFWREFRRRVRAVNPEAYIVGEIWHDAHRWLSGDQFDAVMNYLFTRPCLAFFGAHTLDQTMNEVSGTGIVHPMNAAAFAERMTRVAAMYPDEITLAQLNLLDSHDTARFLNAVGGDHGAFRLATVFQMTYVGAPCIYYGDEIGLPGGPDPDCRRAFPWDTPDSWDLDTLELVRRLVRARRASKVLTRGPFEVISAYGETLAYRRVLSGQAVYVLLNADRKRQVVYLASLVPGWYREVLSGARIHLGEHHTFSVEPRQGMVLVPIEECQD